MSWLSKDPSRFFQFLVKLWGVFVDEIRFHTDKK
jgi:hypothetical protein